MAKIRIDEILVVGRHRRDLGDISGLAKSIAAVGLINPITITSGGQLIAGQRRMEACRSLGWDAIDIIVADDLDTATARLTAERDENTERKAMTMQELVRLGRALEKLERPKAAARKAQARGEPRGNKVSCGDLTTRDRGKTREIVAEALGISGFTYDRAKKVVAAAEDATLPPEDRAMARAALDDMNVTGNVFGNYDKVRKVRDPRLGVRQKSVISDAKKQRRTIIAAAATLSGIAHGLKKIETLHADITSEEAAQWVDDLSETRRVIESLIKRLKERTNA